MGGGFFEKNMAEKEKKDKEQTKSDQNYLKQFAILVAQQLSNIETEIKNDKKAEKNDSKEREKWLNKREKYLNELAEQIQSMLDIIEQQFSLKNYGIDKDLGTNINLNLEANSHHRIFEFDYCEIERYWEIGDTTERQLFLILAMVSKDHDERIKCHLFCPKTYNEFGVALCRTIYNEAEINGWENHIEWDGDLNADNENLKHKDDISSFILDALGPELKESQKNRVKVEVTN